MPIEYAGYVPSETRVNWEGLTDEFAKKTTDVIKARQGERQALDQIAIDNSKTISDQELGKTQTVNDFIVKSGFKSKDFIANANKELKAGRITPEQYRRTMNNISSNWGTLAGSAKTYDTRRQEILKRQQQDPEGNIAGSSYEIELQRINEEALDMQNNNLHIGTDGTMYLGKVDPKTGIIAGELNDVRSLNIPENIMANRVNVNKESNEGIEGWGDFARFTDLGGGADITVEGVYHNPDYKLARQYLVEKIASDSDPRRQLSVLADNGGLIPEYYFTDEEKKSKKQALIDQLAKTKSEAGLDPPTKAELDAIELNMVKQVRKPNGVIDPELTKEQQIEAKKIASNNIDVVVENKITGHGKEDRYHAPIKSNDDGSGSGIKGMPRTYADYQTIQRAIKTGDVSILNGASLGGITYKRNANGSLSSYRKKGTWVNGKVLTEDVPINNNITNGLDIANDIIKPYRGYSAHDRYELQKGWENEDNPESIVTSEERTQTHEDAHDWTPTQYAYVYKLMKANGVSKDKSGTILKLIDENPNMGHSELIKKYKSGKLKLRGNTGKKTDSLGIL